MNGKFHLNTKSVEDISSLYEMVHRRGGCAWRQAAFKVSNEGVLPGSGRALPCRRPVKGQVKSQVKDYFVLPEGSPSRAGSRPGPAPALSGKHDRPLRGCPQQKPFPDGPGAIRSCSARPLAASLRLVLENAFASAFVMPPQGQNPGQGQRRFRSA